jgi:hypothetical protein
MGSYGFVKAIFDFRVSCFLDSPSELEIIPTDNITFDGLMLNRLKRLRHYLKILKTTLSLAM